MFMWIHSLPTMLKLGSQMPFCFLVWSSSAIFANSKCKFFAYKCCGQQLTQKLEITLEACCGQQLTQKLEITLETSELEPITLKERKLEVVLILEEQIQLVLTRVRDKVSRSSIYTAKILLETLMLESWLHIPIKESFALSLLLSRPWHQLAPPPN
jgi:hypothetical protein